MCVIRLKGWVGVFQADWSKEELREEVNKYTVTRVLGE